MERQIDNTWNEINHYESRKPEIYYLQPPKLLKRPRTIVVKIPRLVSFRTRKQQASLLELAKRQKNPVRVHRKSAGCTVYGLGGRLALKWEYAEHLADALITALAQKRTPSIRCQMFKER